MYHSEISFSEIPESPKIHTVGQIIENEVFRFDAVGDLLAVGVLVSISDAMHYEFIMHRIASLISSLPDSQDFAAVPVVWTSHGKATDAHTMSHAV